MASRLLTDLLPPVQLQAHAFTAYCMQAGLEVLIYCTYRPEAEQAVLFRMGRSLFEIKQKAKELEREWNRPDLAELLLTTPPQLDPVVRTWAGPGQSIHNYQMAFDAVPLVAGRPMWSAELLEDLHRWEVMGELAESAGLEWGGRWPEKKMDRPHCQAQKVDWRELIGGVV